MSLRPILILPDPRLRKVAAPVNEITDAHKKLIADMFETMYDAPGIGLAATQIGVMERIVVVDCAKRAAEEAAEGEAEEEAAADEEPDPIALINPEIIWTSDEMRFHEEGCLSIPEYYEEVERPDRIRIRYTTPEGETVEREAGGVLATCMQHEVDHLDGKLFIDYLSRLKRDRVTKKFEKAAKRAAG
jgi:peptide deformylase